MARHTDLWHFREVAGYFFFRLVRFFLLFAASRSLATLDNSLKYSGSRRSCLIRWSASAAAALIFGAGAKCQGSPCLTSVLLDNRNTSKQPFHLRISFGVRSFIFDSCLTSLVVSLIFGYTLYPSWLS